jgi:hypothetical protein
VLQYKDERDNFFRICGLENINTVWFQVDADSSKFFENRDGFPVDAIPAFIQEANSRGMEVHALLGGPNSYLEELEPLKSYVEAVLKYNEEHPYARFAGIHLDVEGNDIGWTQSELLHQWVGFMQALKTWSPPDYPGKTVTTQGLTLSLYEAYPPGLDGSTLQEWLDYVSQFDLVCLQVYGDSFDFIKEQRMLGRPDILEQHDIPFVLLLETDELDRESQSYTLYEEGKDDFYSTRAELNEHYCKEYGLFYGFGLHHYQRAISSWHDIQSVIWPSGEYHQGQAVPVTVGLHTSDNYSKKAQGVELEIRDDSGQIWNTSKIVVLDKFEARDITLEWTVPKDTPSGTYDMTLTIYDLDWFRDMRDPLAYVYDDFVQRYHLPPLEELSIGQFSKLVADYPSIFYGRGRKVPIVLDYTWWQVDCFTVT